MKNSLSPLQIVTLCMATMLAWSTASGQECQKIGAPAVKHKMEKFGAVLINVLSKIEHDMQHIAGSINIPLMDMEKTDKLPAAKDTPLIFYCMGDI